MNIHSASTLWKITAPLVATLALVAIASAQPPGDRPPGDGPRGPADRLRAALDANGDHELDAAELDGAAKALRSLDQDGDGRIGRHEFGPPLPPRPPQFDERGPEARPPRDGRPEGRRPRDGGRPDGPPARPRRESPPGPPGGAGGTQGGGPGPSPERFVTRALSFDADGDGKLDRDELTSFAAEVATRMRGGGERFRGDGPPRRGPPDSAPEGDRPMPPE